MPKKISAVLLAGALLALPADALGKCAIVRLSPAPGGELDIKVLIPGGWVVRELRPRVLIRQGAQREAFASSPTKRAGVYRADVRFPGPGTWQFRVDDGFDALEPGAGVVHRFEDVRVDAGQAQLAAVPERRGPDRCKEMMGPVELGEPEGQLAPEVFAPPQAEEADGDGVSAASFAAAGAFLLLVLAGLGLRRGTRSET